MAKSFERGWEIYYDGERWRYSDTHAVCDGRRPCKRCHKEPNSDGNDFCLGEIRGVSSACCGHGVSKPILMLENKTFLGCMFNDLEDIHEGTDEEVDDELENYGIDVEKAKISFLGAIKRLKER